MRVYLDTDLWNVSCDQNSSPSRILESLDRRGWTPVLGMHVVYELLKNFSNGNTERGRQLFSHVHGYLQAGLRCISKDFSEILVAEMYSLKGAHAAEKFLTFEDVEKISVEIERLSCGDVQSKWYEHIEDKQAAAARDRERVRLGISQNTSHRDFLRKVSDANLDEWLRESTDTEVGRQILFMNLRARFPAEPDAELREYAAGLLKIDARGAGALVRADIYYAWRCANRGSNPKDLLDDIYHVLSASYCNAYATGEIKQAEYASLLLWRDVRVCTYSRQHQLNQWLASAVARQSTPR
jgi:hypothetical protein